MAPFLACTSASATARMTDGDRGRSAQVGLQGCPLEEWRALTRVLPSLMLRTVGASTTLECRVSQGRRVLFFNAPASSASRTANFQAIYAALRNAVAGRLLGIFAAFERPLKKARALKQTAKTSSFHTSFTLEIHDGSCAYNDYQHDFIN